MRRDEKRQKGRIRLSRVLLVLAVVLCTLSMASGLIVELLHSDVRPGDVTRFLELDKSIWTTFLEQQPGFVSKESWIAYDEANNNNNVTRVWSCVRWASFRQWKSIDPALLAATEKKFEKALGTLPIPPPYPMAMALLLYRWMCSSFCFFL